MAQLSARMLMIDALGSRLTEMAGIDAEEFDFSADAPVGGPEEPMPTGSNVAVPEIIGAMDSLDGELANREAQLSVLESLLISENLKERVHPQGRPVTSGWISSYFGKRTDPFTGKAANHTGIDFAGKHGSDVVAVADGVVSWSGDRFGYGVMVEPSVGRLDVRSVWYTATTRDASAYGSGLNSTARTALNIVVDAPIPSPSVSTVTTANPGSLRNERHA
jgi:hypothetical protein